MINLQIGFWVCMIGALLSAWLLVGSPLMIYLTMTGMVFLTGIFVLIGLKRIVITAIDVSFHIAKNGLPEEIDEQKDSSV